MYLIGDFSGLRETLTIFRGVWAVVILVKTLLSVLNVGVLRFEVITFLGVTGGWTVILGTERFFFYITLGGLLSKKLILGLFIAPTTVTLGTLLTVLIGLKDL